MTRDPTPVFRIEDDEDLRLDREHCEVSEAILVEVGCHQLLFALSGEEDPGPGTELAVPDAAGNGEARGFGHVVVRAQEGEIEMPVAVEVRSDDGLRDSVYLRRGRLLRQV